MWIKTYGNLYFKLTKTTGEIPIGIYRTMLKETNSNKTDFQRLIVYDFFMIFF
jgi:6-phosphogluconolactonase/glucosamine-6-phosphate isomerase/deaminase